MEPKIEKLGKVNGWEIGREVEYLPNGWREVTYFINSEKGLQQVFAPSGELVETRNLPPIEHFGQHFVNQIIQKYGVKPIEPTKPVDIRPIAEELAKLAKATAEMAKPKEVNEKEERVIKGKLAITEVLKAQGITRLSKEVRILGNFLEVTYSGNVPKNQHGYDYEGPIVTQIIGNEGVPVEHVVATQLTSVTGKAMDIAGAVLQEYGAKRPNIDRPGRDGSWTARG